MLMSLAKFRHAEAYLAPIVKNNQQILRLPVDLHNWLNCLQVYCESEVMLSNAILNHSLSKNTHLILAKFYRVLNMLANMKVLPGNKTLCTSVVRIRIKYLKLIINLINMKPKDLSSEPFSHEFISKASIISDLLFNITNIAGKSHPKCITSLNKYFRSNFHFFKYFYNQLNTLLHKEA